MATYTIQLSNQPIRNSKEYALMLRITVDRKHARRKLIHSVIKHDFNEKTKTGAFIRTSNPNHVKLNKYLANEIHEAKLAEEAIEKRNGMLTASAIKEELIKPKSSSIYEFMELHIDQLLRSNTIGTYKKYKVILGVLKEYSKKDDLRFGHIDAGFLNELQTWLLSNGKSQTTVHGYLSKIRTVFNKAVAEGKIKLTDSPFTTYKLKQGKPIKERLSIEEIKRIEELDLNDKGKIRDVKNSFLFAYYTAGMRIADVLLLKWDNVNDGLLKYKMHKTGKQHELKLVSKAINILKEYEMNNKEGFVFPFMDVRYNLDNPSILHNQIGAKTALINKYLKDIAPLAKIKKKITTHTARHSFADMARRQDVDIYAISKLLGHGDIKVTQAYLAEFDTNAEDKAMDKLFG